MKKNKQSKFIVTLKIIMIILGIVFSFVMPIMAGAGLVYNTQSYGEQISDYGKLMILSAILMAFGGIFCIFRKTLPNIISAVCSCSGFALCMAMLYKICDHADRAGWSDNYSMTPISSMYKARIIPCVAPFAIALIVALIQIFSYDAIEERRKKKREKQEKLNAPAPKIIEDD